jgi:RNA polymerase sigma-70 factor, ECF subfamily
MNNEASQGERSEKFTQQVIACQRMLYSYILTLVPNFNEANDILQQTNIALWRNAQRFEQGTDFNAWACRVAYFAVLEHREKTQRTNARFSDVLLDCLSREAEADIDNEDMRLKALSQCLHELPNRWRDLIDRKYVKEEVTKAIAASMGQTANAVTNTLFRIRQALWKCIRRRMVLEEGT